MTCLFRIVFIAYAIWWMVAHAHAHPSSSQHCHLDSNTTHRCH